jgi:hypothetical protein
MIHVQESRDALLDSILPQARRAQHRIDRVDPRDRLGRPGRRALGALARDPSVTALDLATAARLKVAELR